MVKKQALLQRLKAIGQSLRESSNALALIGLSSAGTGLERLDDFSDLDFFIIAKLPSVLSLSASRTAYTVTRSFSRMASTVSLRILSQVNQIKHLMNLLELSGKQRSSTQSFTFAQHRNR